MSKYQYTKEMGEISGFGGDYEVDCRNMVIAGLEWLDEHPNADPKFHGFKGIYGVIEEDNQDAKDLSDVVINACDGCSGAMHQATIGHILHIKEFGWGKYVEEMTIKS
jgi:hypothetical protein